MENDSTRGAVLDLVNLTPLMQLTSGRAEIAIGLIDGPVAVHHPDLAFEHIRKIAGIPNEGCAHVGSSACMHGTFVAGILSAKRGSAAPAICPSCTLLLRPIFAETVSANESGWLPRASPEELATAIIECIDAGARVINISAALAEPSTKAERELEGALNYAANRGGIVVAAAGNQGAIGSSSITRHPWVIPVAACDLRGRLLRQSNLGSSIGRRGVSVPGEEITSLGAGGGSISFGGTSAATPFVTGTLALLWSAFPRASTPTLKLAVTHTHGSRRPTVVPPLLNAWAAFQVLREFSRN
jgi:subtilisin family serine protease